MAKALFVTAGDESWGSSRIRAYWPAKYMNADTMTFEDHQIAKTKDFNYSVYDVVVFQKVFDFSYAEFARERGQRIVWDACDPAWWWEPKQTKQIVQEVDAITFSSVNLLNDFKEWTRFPYAADTYVVADRIEMEAYPKQRQHVYSDLTRFIWFGLAANRFALNAAIPYLERLHANDHKVELTIFDDRPDVRSLVARFPIYHSFWELDKENATIASHDVAILPPYPGPWGRVKSNNRVLTAWACGIPAVYGDDFWTMENMTNAFARKNAVEEARQCLEEYYNVQKSAIELEAVFKEIGAE